MEKGLYTLEIGYNPFLLNIMYEILIKLIVYTCLLRILHCKHQFSAGQSPAFQ